MNFEINKKHVAIVALYAYRTTAKMIHQMLKPLSVNEQFVSQTLANYRETIDVVDRPREGLLRSVHTRQNIHVICRRWNLVHKQKHLTAEMNISIRSLCHILKEDLSLGAY